MSLLVLDRVVLRMAGRTLLDGAELRVDPGRRIGLVGRNGAGKSTLLKAIAGELPVDGGEIVLSARARLAQVRQEAPSGEASLLDTVLQADTERLALLAELDTAEPLRLAEAHERLRAIGADAAPARAAAILAGLGFDATAQARPVDSFSGGLAHAGSARRGAVRRPRPAAARRADQPPRPRGDAVARGLARPLPRRLPDRLARPRAAGPRRAGHRPPRPAPHRLHARRLRRVRAPAHRARHADRPRRRAHRRPARAYAELRGPFSRQGDEGAARRRRGSRRWRSCRCSTR